MNFRIIFACLLLVGFVSTAFSAEETKGVDATYSIEISNVKRFHRKARFEVGATKLQIANLPTATAGKIWETMAKWSREHKTGAVQIFDLSDFSAASVNKVVTCYIYDTSLT